MLFPIQNDGRKEKQKQKGEEIKYGAAAPNIISEDNFVTAIPSSLFDDKAVIRRAIIIPCNVPVRDRKMICAADRSVSRNMGSSTAVVTKAKSAGITMREIVYPFFPKPVINK